MIQTRTKNYEAGHAAATAWIKGGRTERLSRDLTTLGPWGDTRDATKQQANRQWLAGWNAGVAS